MASSKTDLRSSARLAGDNKNELVITRASAKFAIGLVHPLTPLMMSFVWHRLRFQIPCSNTGAPVGLSAIDPIKIDLVKSLLTIVDLCRKGAEIPISFPIIFPVMLLFLSYSYYATSRLTLEKT